MERTPKQLKEQEKANELSLIETHSIMDFVPDQRLLDMHTPASPQLYDVMFEGPTKT